jgi:hypothetical protein
VALLAVPPHLWHLNALAGQQLAPATPPGLALQASLEEAYPLSLHFPNTQGPWAHGQSLAHLQTLHQGLLPFLQQQGWVPWPCPTLHWLDVGCQYWGYAPAQVAFATTLLPPHGAVHLHACEVDADKAYPNGGTRGGYAQGMAQALNKATTQALFFPIAAEALPLCQVYGLITQHLPFVLPQAHVQWGLPLSLFNPQHTLLALLQRLAVGGVLFITNLTPHEGEAQAALLPWAVQEALARWGGRYQWRALGHLPLGLLVRTAHHQRPHFVCWRVG